MPIPLLTIFSCGVGGTPASEFDEKDFFKGFILLMFLAGRVQNFGEQLSLPALELVFLAS